MNKKIKGPTLLTLNDDCLYEIYKILALDDCINLDDTCSRLTYVANLVYKYKNFSKFIIDEEMIKNDEYIDRTLSHVGQHISSLRFDFGKLKFQESVNTWKLSSEYCIGLKSLHIKGRLNVPDFSYATFNCSNIQTLTFEKCNLTSGKDFLNSFGNLKYLNFDECLFDDPVDWKILFEKNRSLESLGFNIFERHRTFELNTLLQLDRLTKLHLDYGGSSDDLNTFLNEMPNKRNMKELHLNRCEVNARTFDILNSYDKLQVLIIETTSECELTPSLAWPANLRQLKLQWFEISFIAFRAIIEQLKHLDEIDLHDCYPSDQDETNFNDLKTVSRQILNAFEPGDNQQRLNVLWPAGWLAQLELSKVIQFGTV